MNIEDRETSVVFLHDQWRKRPFFILHLAALLLHASWLWQFTRRAWDFTDLIIFRFLNGFLNESGSIWNYVWAIGNMRPADMLFGLIMLAVMVIPKREYTGAQIRKNGYALCVSLLLLLLTRAIYTKFIEYKGWQRKSPSLVVEDAVRLSAIFPTWRARWKMKDSSSSCVPGDHAAVLLLWGVCMIFPFSCCKKRLAAIWGLTIFFILPRMVAGAHWFSDAAVSGMFLVLIATAWCYYTPLAFKISRFVERLALPLVRLLRRVPPLHRLAALAE